MDSIDRAANIKSDLYKAGYSLSAIDRKYKLRRATIANTLKEPNEKGEAAIADVLGTPAHELFPERYDETGQRLRPQPRSNYERPPTMAQRRKGKAA